MTPDVHLLSRLKQIGYFERGEFDPDPVYQVCRLHFGMDARTPAGREQIDAMIRRLTVGGLVRFEYSSDPALHPKDTLDYWRIVLTPAGLDALKQANGG